VAELIYTVNVATPAGWLYFGPSVVGVVFLYTRPMDTSAPTQKCETLRHETHSVEMSWVRSVLGPKCPYTLVTILWQSYDEVMTNFYWISDRSEVAHLNWTVTRIGDDFMIDLW